MMQPMWSNHYQSVNVTELIKKGNIVLFRTFKRSILQCFANGMWKLIEIMRKILYCNFFRVSSFRFESRTCDCWLKSKSWLKYFTFLHSWKTQQFLEKIFLASESLYVTVQKSIRNNSRKSYEGLATGTHQLAIANHVIKPFPSIQFHWVASKLSMNFLQCPYPMIRSEIAWHRIENLGFCDTNALDFHPKIARTHKHI